MTLYDTRFQFFLLSMAPSWVSACSLLCGPSVRSNKLMPALYAAVTTASSCSSLMAVLYVVHVASPMLDTRRPLLPKFRYRRPDVKLGDCAADDTRSTDSLTAAACSLAHSCSVVLPRSAMQSRLAIGALHLPTRTNCSLKHHIGTHIRYIMLFRHLGINTSVTYRH